VARALSGVQVRRVAVIALVALLAVACVRKVELHPDGGRMDSAIGGLDAGLGDEGGLPDANITDDAGGAAPDAAADGG
jgi:hypothetical protein